jgi:phosphatidylserine decarboxylase
VCEDPDSLIAPCDGLLTAIPIKDDTVLHVKQSEFSISKLLRSRKLAERYKDGTALVFRLCVDNYHRYSYIESGIKSKNRFIEGVLHTVRPVALAERPVFTENCREYCLIRTERFGTLVQMEVGAMLVGKISNDSLVEGPVKRGAEKGHFEYGGSTIIVLLSADKASLRQDILDCVNSDEEIPVKMGEVIGKRI